MANNTDDFLPLSPQVFHILLALAGNDLHGYAIIQEIASQSDGKMALGAGTLYTALKRLLANGLVEELEERPDPALDDQRRRYYRLTPLGKAVAKAEAQRLAGLLKVARDRRIIREV